MVEPRRVGYATSFGRTDAASVPYDEVVRADGAVAAWHFGQGVPVLQDMVGHGGPLVVTGSFVEGTYGGVPWQEGAFASRWMPWSDLNGAVLEFIGFGNLLAVHPLDSLNAITAAHIMEGGIWIVGAGSLHAGGLEGMAAPGGGPDLLVHVVARVHRTEGIRVLWNGMEASPDVELWERLSGGYPLPGGFEPVPRFLSVQLFGTFARCALYRSDVVPDVAVLADRHWDAWQTHGLGVQHRTPSAVRLTVASGLGVVTVDTYDAEVLVDSPTAYYPLRDDGEDMADGPFGALTPADTFIEVAGLSLCGNMALTSVNTVDTGAISELTVEAVVQPGQWVTVGGMNADLSVTFGEEWVGHGGEGMTVGLRQRVGSVLGGWYAEGQVWPPRPVHVVFTMDETETRLYVDGQFVNGALVEPMTVIPADAGLRVSADMPAENGIGRIAVYVGTVLSEARVRAHAQAFLDMLGAGPTTSYLYETWSPTVGIPPVEYRYATWGLREPVGPALLRYETLTSLLPVGSFAYHALSAFGRGRGDGAVDVVEYVYEFRPGQPEYQGSHR